VSLSQQRVLIATNHGGVVRFGDRDRLTALDLRKLFLHKPDLASIVYDTLVEEGIVLEEGLHEGEEGDMDELGITMDELALMHPEAVEGEEEG
jgi:hypothetical protein